MDFPNDLLWLIHGGMGWGAIPEAEPGLALGADSDARNGGLLRNATGRQIEILDALGSNTIWRKWRSFSDECGFANQKL